MEHGECSGANASEEVWAKLIPLDARYSDVDIMSKEMVVCSEITCTSFKKQKWCRITKNPDTYSATIENMSSDAIVADENVLQKGDSMVIKCGTEIILGPDKEGYLIFRFEVMPTEEPPTKLLKISLDVEHAKCSICLNVWHDVVTVAPCLHNFCNGCFSEWLRMCQGKRSTVLCPQCRGVVHFVGRNHFLHNIEEDILHCDATLRHSDEEIAILNANASIKSNLVMRTGKIRKRPHSPPDEETNSNNFRCPQCVADIGGFHCNQTTDHLQCQACGGMMPSRTDINVPQHCLGCDRAFCWAYWRAQGVVRGVQFQICAHENFKPISEHAISRIPHSAHENNQFEQDITESCIRQSGKTLQVVISEWISKLNNREIDRTRMPLNHAEMITAGSCICNDCYEKLVTFLLYWFRISTPKHLLPPHASKREDCWYGYACRTQHHNEDHARKRNHVCRPTRGNHIDSMCEDISAQMEMIYEKLQKLKSIEAQLMDLRKDVVGLKLLLVVGITLAVALLFF